MAYSIDENEIEKLSLSMKSVNLNNLCGIITQSQKGGPQLYYQGHYYRVNTQRKTGSIKWR